MLISHKHIITGKLFAVKLHIHTVYSATFWGPLTLPKWIESILEFIESQILRTKIFSQPVKIQMRSFKRLTVHLLTCSYCANRQCLFLLYYFIVLLLRRWTIYLLQLSLSVSRHVNPVFIHVFWKASEANLSVCDTVTPKISSKYPQNYNH